ncbi:MAG: hypothetical protein HYZ83_02465, partial [Candidatus Omnitrophica bacterium]|nr:hypothetical protein [Candidatus Omnitrophota bacterium]
NLQDWSKVDVTMVSETFATIDFNLFNTGGNKVGNDTVPASFGGVFIDYDDPKTTGGVIETIDLNALFPNGIVFGLDHGGTGLTEVFFEVTDITGKKDRVKLTGIEGTGKRWNVPVGRFDEVDVTKIKTLVLGAEGRHVGQKLNVDWGNFSFVPGVVADATNPAITKVPQAGRKDDAGNTNLVRPDLTGFQSNNTDRRAPGTAFQSDTDLQDWSNVEVKQTSISGAEITFNLFNKGGKVNGKDVPDSFGGVFFDYDDPKTTGGVIETIDLNTAFPDGIVIELSNGGTGLTEVFLEATDITGKKDRARLVGIDGTNRRWKILTGQFDEVDRTKVRSLALVAVGRHVGEKLIVEWGDFSFTPSVDSDASNPAITKVPQATKKDVNGKDVLVRPDLTGFQSNNTDRRAPGTQPQSDPDLQDWSSVDVKQTSITSTEITFNLFNKGGKVNGKDVPDSFGGIVIDYDNPATNDNDKLTTTDIETIDLNTVFPDGIVIELNNGGTGINEVFLEVTDINGKKDQVRLINVTAAAKRWKIIPGLFDGVDRAKIRSLALVAVGRHVGEKLNVEWGDFNFVPVVTI